MSPAHHAHCPAGVPDALQGPKVAPSPQNHLPSPTGGGRSRAAVSVLSNQQRKVLPDFSFSSEQGRNTEDGKSRHIRVQFELFHRPPAYERRQSQIPCPAAPQQPHCTSCPEKAAKGISLWTILEGMGPFRCLFASKSR